MISIVNLIFSESGILKCKGQNEDVKQRKVFEVLYSVTLINVQTLWQMVISKRGALIFSSKNVCILSVVSSRRWHIRVLWIVNCLKFFWRADDVQIWANVYYDLTQKEWTLKFFEIWEEPLFEWKRSFAVCIYINNFNETGIMIHAIGLKNIFLIFFIKVTKLS